MDYEETFVVVAKITVVHTFLAIVLVRQWCVTQLDVKNVFLNGDLYEEVYMEPLLVFRMILGMFASTRRHYMVSNKRIVLGLRNSFL